MHNLVFQTYIYVFFSLPLAGGEVLPVPWRAANEDVENVNLATRGIQVRAAHLHTHKHLNAMGAKFQSRQKSCIIIWMLKTQFKTTKILHLPWHWLSHAESQQRHTLCLDQCKLNWTELKISAIMLFWVVVKCWGSILQIAHCSF